MPAAASQGGGLHIQNRESEVNENVTFNFLSLCNI
jgi:hypothetical protein